MTVGHASLDKKIAGVRAAPLRGDRARLPLLAVLCGLVAAAGFGCDGGISVDKENVHRPVQDEAPGLSSLRGTEAGDGTDPYPFGVPGRKKLSQLSLSEKRSLCDWKNDVTFGGYGVQEALSTGYLLDSDADQNACLIRDSGLATCPMRVDDYVACIRYMAEDVCDFEYRSQAAACAMVLPCVYPDPPIRDRSWYGRICSGSGRPRALLSALHQTHKVSRRPAIRPPSTGMVVPVR